MRHTIEQLELTQFGRFLPFPFLSFPRKRESRVLLLNLDSRFFARERIRPSADTDNDATRVSPKQKKGTILQKMFSVPCFMLHASCRRGFSLIELLVYIAAFSLVLLAIVNVSIVMVRSYAALRSVAAVERNASALVRIAREIQGSASVSDGDSVFGLHPGRLFLNTTDVNGAPRTALFYLDGDALVLKENNGAPQLFTAPDVSASNLVFRKIVTPRSVGVKIELTLESGRGASFHRENFYDTVVLRDAD